MTCRGMEVCLHSFVTSATGWSASCTVRFTSRGESYRKRLKWGLRVGPETGRTPGRKNNSLRLLIIQPAVHVCTLSFVNTNNFMLTAYVNNPFPPKRQCVPTIDSSVGIASRYMLDGSGIESLWGARFFSPAQTLSGSHTASCRMGTGSWG